MKRSRILSAVLCVVFLFSFSTTALASEEIQSPPQPYDGNYPQTLIPVEQAPYKPSVAPRFGYSIEITDTYRGEANSRIVTENELSTTESTLGFSRSLDWSNSYSANVGISAEIISSEVGYDVTYGSSDEASYEVVVPAYTKCYIYCKDVLNVTNFDIFQFGSKVGNGWASEFSDFSFWHRFD